MLNSTIDSVTTEVVSPLLLQFFTTFNLLVCAQFINVCGLLGNIINIINFKKQGMRDSVNVTLTALAVSDFGALFFQLVVNILMSPFWRGVEISFSSSSTLSMLFFYPHGYFIRVSGFITAFAAFERCLCVVLPIRVKIIMTRNVAVAANCGIFIVLLLYLYPEFAVIYFAWVFIPALNRTVITSVIRDYYTFQKVMSITNVVEDLFLPYVTFLILILCTAIIVVQLKINAKWRRSVTGNKSILSKTELSNKDKKTVIMLTVVSIMFTALLTPQCLLMAVAGIIQDMRTDAPLWDITLLIYSFTSLLETISCSVNIIVYYNMSTRYREIIHIWFYGLMTRIK